MECNFCSGPMKTEQVPNRCTVTIMYQWLFDFRSASVFKPSPPCGGLKILFGPVATPARRGGRGKVTEMVSRERGCGCYGKRLASMLCKLGDRLVFRTIERKQRVDEHG